jgi:hypothetical protein
MKKLLKEIRKYEKEIEILEQELVNVPKGDFYRYFGSPDMMKREMDVIQQDINFAKKEIMYNLLQIQKEINNKINKL